MPISSRVSLGEHLAKVRLPDFWISSHNYGFAHVVLLGELTFLLANPDHICFIWSNQLLD